MTNPYPLPDWLAGLRQRLSITHADEVTVAAPSEVPNADLPAFWDALLVELPGWRPGDGPPYRDGGRTKDLVRVGAEGAGARMTHGQLVIYTGHHITMRNKPWRYIGEYREQAAGGARFAVLLPADTPRDMLPTIEEFNDMRQASRAFYSNLRHVDGKEPDHPARLANKLWWFDVLSVHAEDVKPVSSADSRD